MIVENRYYMDIEVVPRLWTGLELELRRKILNHVKREIDYINKIEYKDQAILIKNHFEYEENLRIFLYHVFDDVARYVCDLWNEEAHKNGNRCWTSLDEMHRICVKFKSGVIEYVICAINEHCRMRNSSQLK